MIPGFGQAIPTFLSFISRPISAVFLIVAVIFLVSPLFTRERIGKRAIEAEG